MIRWPMDPQLFLSILLLLIVVISVLVASHGAKQTGKKEGTILPIVTSKRTKPKAIVAFRGIGVLALLMLFTVKCISFVGLNGVGNALFSFGGEDMRNQTKPSALFQFGGTSMQPGNLIHVEKPISTADLMLGNRSQLPTYAQQNNVIVMPITDASTNQVDNVDICSIPLSTRREDTWSDDIEFPEFQQKRDPAVFKLTFNKLTAHPIARKHLSEFSEKSLELVEREGYFLNPDSEYVDPFSVTDAVDVESGVSTTNTTHRDGLIYGLFHMTTPTIGMDIDVQFDNDEWYTGTITNVVESDDIYTVTVIFDDDNAVGTFTYPDGYYIRLVPDDTLLMKGGITNNSTDRQIYYRVDPNYPNYNRDFKMLGLIYFDRIPYKLDQKLAAIKLEYMNAVINDPDISSPMKRMYESLLSPAENANGREWHRIGPGRQIGMQMLEVGVQKRLNIRGNRTIASPAEGFMWNDTKHDYMVSTAIGAVEEMIPVIDNVISERNGNVRILHISTWRAGCAADKLSSAIVAAEYIIGPTGTWFNTIDDALFPNAKTDEEMFAKNFTVAQYDEADKVFCKGLQQPSTCNDEPEIIYGDTQGYMYGDLVEPQKVAHRLGFRHSKTLLGGEIIMYQHQLCNTLLIFHGHLAVAGDSQPSTSVINSQARGTSIDALKQSRMYATGEAANATDGFDDSAIFGTQVIEVFEHGLHNANKAKKGAVVPYKDVLTPSTVSAVDSFGAWKTPSYADGGSFLNPSSDYAREKRSQNKKENMIGETKILNKFSNFTSDTLYANLTTLNNQICTDTKTGNRNRAWNNIMRYLSPVAKGDLLFKMEEWASINNVQLRIQERVKWTAEEEAQVRAFGSWGNVAPVGDKSLEQTRKKYVNLIQKDNKRKAAANAGETKKKRKLD